MDKSLEKWRKQIDKCDQELMNILAKRINIAKEIGKYKKVHGMPLFDKKRWQEVLRSKLVKARSLNISERFIEKLYKIIHKNSLEIEEEN